MVNTLSRQKYEIFLLDPIFMWLPDKDESYYFQKIDLILDKALVSDFALTKTFSNRLTINTASSNL